MPAACVVVAGAHLRLPRARQTHPALVEALQARLAVPHPDYKRSHRRQRPDEPEDWCPVWPDGSGGDVLVGRGHVQELRQVAGKLGVPLDFTSRVRTYDGAAPLEAPDRAPRPYQREAIGAMIKGVQGVVVIPCGGGKTTIASHALREVGWPALVLVPTVDIADQFAATLRATGWRKIRRVGGGRHDDLSPLQPGQIMVAIPDGLWAAAGDQLPRLMPLLSSAGVLVLDEAQNIAAQRILALVNACPARYRWAMTATPDRPDGWHVLLPALFGPVLYSITARRLIELGFLQAPIVVPVATGWEPGENHYTWTVQCPVCNGSPEVVLAELRAGTSKCTAKVGPAGKRKTCASIFPADLEAFKGPLIYAMTTTALACDRKRLELMLQLASDGARMGRLVLTLIGRKPQAAFLATRLRTSGLRSVALDSSVSKGMRRDVIESARTRELQVLVATRLADVGLDVPALGMVVMGESVKHAGRALQRVGRVCRPCGDPERPLVFDLVDGGPTFARHWVSRRTAYEAEYGPECVYSRKPVSVEEALAVLHGASEDRQTTI